MYVLPVIATSSIQISTIFLLHFQKLGFPLGLLPAKTVLPSQSASYLHHHQGAGCNTDDLIYNFKQELTNNEWKNAKLLFIQYVIYLFIYIIPAVIY